MQKLKLDELNRMSDQDFRESKKNPVILILDNVRSLNNVGSAFRTADAFRIEKIYLCGITGVPPHRDIHKTALGATDTVVWEYAQDTLTVINQLKAAHWKILSLEQTSGSTQLQEFRPSATEKYAFVFGNEVFGVSQEVIEKSNGCLEIPQFGTKHSINISVSLGIVCWHYVNSLLQSGMHLK